MLHFLIRLGSLAELCIGESKEALQRGQRVIVRSEIGVQVAEIVGPCGQHDFGSREHATILRATTDEDELLISRLNQHKREAVESCRKRLREAGSSATLLDVDQLFDGGTLLMHFLGAVDEIAQTITNEVAEQYERVVGSTQFAQRLSEGCGPACGTQAGQGCASKCAGCTIKCH